MKIFFKKHWLGLVLSIVIGAIIAAPPIIFRFSDYYQGVDMLKTNTETHYLTQIQEVYDGHSDLGNPFYADLKDELYLFPPLSPNIMATFGKLFSLSAVEAVMIFRFFITALLSFFIYLFCFFVTGRRMVGLVAAPFVLLGYSLMDPGNIINAFRNGAWLQEKTFIDYGRPINPQLSSLFFFVYLVFFWKYLQEKSKLRYGILSILFLGFSFYVYLYTWTFIFSLNAFLFIIYAIKKDWLKVKKIIGVSAVAGLIGIPYLIHVFAVSSHQWYAESARRFGFINSREPNVSRLVLALLILFGVSFKKFATQIRLFFLAFFLTALFVVNEQIITGFYIFNHHYHWYYITPLAIIFLVVWLFTILTKFSIRRLFVRALTAALVVLFLFNGIQAQIESYAHNLPAVIEEQRHTPLFTWLNEEDKKDVAVFTPLPLADLVLSLTHANVYHDGTGMYTLVPDERLMHIYTAYRYLDRVPKDDIENYLDTHRDEVSFFVFGYAYRLQKGGCTGCIPDSVLESIATEYKNLSDENFIEYLKQYPVDYIIWDKKENPDWELDRFSLDKVQEFGEIVVYSVR